MHVPALVMAEEPFVSHRGAASCLLRCVSERWCFHRFLLPLSAVVLSKQQYLLPESVRSGRCQPQENATSVLDCKERDKPASLTFRNSGLEHLLPVIV